MSLRVAIVHDYLTQRGGAERVVLSMLREFPDARLVTSVYDPGGTYREFEKYPVETLWMDRVSLLRRDPRRALPLLAKAFSSLHISDVDVVISSSSGWAHGVQHATPRRSSTATTRRAGCTRPRTTSPSTGCRSGWRWRRCAGRSPAGTTGPRHPPRSTWPTPPRCATGCGSPTASTPRCCTPRSASTRPARTSRWSGLEPGFLLSVSRRRAYKNAEVVARAVEQVPGERLVLVGGLPEPSDGRPWSDRVVGVTGVSDAQLRWLYANCSGLLALGHEDFGLTPLEANVFGKPVVCLRAGGYLDTVVDGRTGVLVDRLAVDEVADGIRRLRATAWDVEAVQDHAEAFSTASFGGRLREIAERVLGRYPHQAPSLVSLPDVEDYPLEPPARAAL